MPARRVAACLCFLSLCAAAAPPSQLLTWGVGGPQRLARDGDTSLPLPVSHGGLAGVSSGAGWAEVAAGGHTCALSADAQVWCWGRNSSDGGGGHGSKPVPDSGQLGHWAGKDGPGPVVLADSGLPFPARPASPRLDGTVACGRYHSAAVGNDGQVYTWGLNDQGQLGRSGTHGTHADPLNQCFSGATCRSGGAAIVRLPLRAGEKVAGVVAGRYSTLAWTDRGHLWTWGLDGCADRLLTATERLLEAQHLPRRVRLPQRLSGGGGLESVPRVRQVAAGYVHWLALTTDGRVFSCDTGDDGYAATLPNGGRKPNADGELGRETDEQGLLGEVITSAYTPGAVTAGGLGGLKVTSVAAGRAHSLAVVGSTGELFSWGNNQAGQLGRTPGLFESNGVPTRAGGLPGPARLAAAGEYFSLASISNRTAGLVVGWGSNGNGQLGRGPKAGKGGLSMGPITVAEHLRGEAVSLAAGYQHAACVLSPAAAAAIAVGGSGGITTLVPATGSLLHFPSPKATPAALSAAAPDDTSPRRREIEATASDVFSALPHPSELIPNIASPCWKGKDGAVSCLPLIHILGVSKCGTTDLYKRLARHPDFVESNNKGPHFWDECPVNSGPTGPPHCTFHGYTSLFSALAQRVSNGGPDAAGLVSADASSNTLTASGVWRRGHNPEGDVTVGELLHAVAPYGRYVIILRDPAERFFSAFHYYRRMFGPRAKGPPSVDEAHAEAVRCIEVWTACLKSERRLGDDAAKMICIRRFEPQQLIKGMYVEFLWDWTGPARFPADQLLVLRLEDYSAAPRRHLEALFTFVGLRQPREEEWSGIVDAPRANAATRGLLREKEEIEPMKAETRALLREFYAPFNARLAAALGDRRFSWDE